MLLGTMRDGGCSGALLVGLLSILVGCSSSGGGGTANGGASGSANGGSSSGGSAGTSSSGAGQGGNAGTISGGAGGAGGTGLGDPSTCLGLQRDATTSVYYTPPDTQTNASIVGVFESGQGLLVALDISRSVRLMAIDHAGVASELLNESEYTRNWSFDPTGVTAIRRSDGVDVLVSDDAHVTLIHKQGSTVTVTPLAETNYLDLHVLGFAPTSSGVLAMYWKGDRATGTDETLTAVDTLSMQKTTRVFHGDSGLVSVPSATGAWLTAERLDFASDCQPTGETVNCGGGTPAVPSSTCTWHLDVWNVKDTSFASADALVTFDVPATISARCDDDTPAGLATYPNTLGSGFGVGSHHAATLDQSTQGLALALQRPTAPNMRGVQFELLDASATRVIDGTTAPLPAGDSQSWLAVRGGNLFMCSGDVCAMSNANTATGFKFSSSPTTVSVDGVALRPNGLALVGGINGNALMQQSVNCSD